MNDVCGKWRKGFLKCAASALALGLMAVGAPLAGDSLYAARTGGVCCEVECLFGRCGTYCPEGGSCHCHFGFPHCKCN